MRIVFGFSYPVSSLLSLPALNTPGGYTPGRHPRPPLPFLLLSSPCSSCGATSVPRSLVLCSSSAHSSPPPSGHVFPPSLFPNPLFPLLSLLPFPSRFPHPFLSPTQNTCPPSLPSPVLFPVSLFPSSFLPHSWLTPFTPPSPLCPHLSLPFSLLPSPPRLSHSSACGSPCMPAHHGPLWKGLDLRPGPACPMPEVTGREAGAPAPPGAPHLPGRLGLISFEFLALSFSLMSFFARSFLSV